MEEKLFIWSLRLIVFSGVAKVLLWIFAFVMALLKDG